MIASRCRSDLAPDCTTSPPFGVNGSRKNGFVVTVSTRALNGGRGASVAACAAVAWGVRTQPLLLPRADRPAAALVPSTSHGAARIMIELHNKHTLTGKLCCFQIVLCAQLGGDFLSQSLTSKGLCRRIHFRRMPSVNDGPSDMPDSGFAATSLLAGSPTSRIFGGLAFCSFSRLA